MKGEDGAGAGDEGDLEGGQGGSGAPSGGSPEGDSGQGNGDGKFIPESRLKAALANQRARYEEKLDGLRAEFEAFKAGGGGKGGGGEQAEPPKRYTRAQLSEAVKAEQITQDQADEIWAKQIETEVTANATKAALETVSRKSTQEGIDADLARYKQLAPEILDESSDERQRIREEFTYLVGKGSPKTLATELAAIRAVLGPLEKLEKARKAPRKSDHHEEGGGEQGGERKNSGGGGKKLVDTLSKREKEHYDAAIKKGLYKDWDAVEKTLSFANPELRRKQGARV